MRLALALLPEIETGVEHFVAWINALRIAAQQTGEWTPDQEAGWRSALTDAKLAPEEVPDSPTG